MIIPGLSKSGLVSLGQLCELNGIARSVCRNFKTGIIQYTKLDKKEVYDEIAKIVMACQKSGQTRTALDQGDLSVGLNSQHKMALKAEQLE